MYQEREWDATPVEPARPNGHKIFLKKSRSIKSGSYMYQERDLNPHDLTVTRFSYSLQLSLRLLLLNRLCSLDFLFTLFSLRT